MINSASRWTHFARENQAECVEHTEWDDAWDLQEVKVVTDSCLTNKFTEFLGDQCKKKIDDIIKHLYSPQGKASRGFFKAMDDDGEDFDSFQTWMAESEMEVKAANLKVFKPHVSVQRTLCVRVGPQCVPFWGHGMWIIAHSEFVVVPVALGVLVDKVSVKTLEKIADIFTERTVCRMQFPVINLKEGDAAWVPFGTLPFITSDKQDELLSYAVIPFIARRMSEKCDDEVLGLVNQSMAKFVKSQSDKELWRTIRTALAEAKEE